MREDGTRESERIDTEAAGWVARLGSADATGAERAACAAWIAADFRHAAAFAEFDQLWSALEGAPVRPPRAEGARRRRAAAGALALLIGLALAALVGPEARLRLRADARAGVGEIRHLSLPDGSRLDLDTGAAVALDFGPRARRVIVLRGAVFAEARPDPARPFTLETDTVTARALGTRFGVEGDAVTVTAGRVEARDAAGARVTLGAGEGARLRDHHFERIPVRAEDTAWRDGRLVVSGRPLAEVLDTLGRYQRGRILLLDRAEARRPVSGVFDLADPARALAILAEGMGLGLHRLPGLTVLR